MTLKIYADNILGQDTKYTNLRYDSFTFENRAGATA